MEAFDDCKRGLIRFESAWDANRQRHDQTTQPNDLDRLPSRLPHGRDLVDPVALSILSNPLLRAVVAEFLPLSDGLPRGPSLCSASFSAPGPPARWPRVPGLPHSIAAKCGPPN